MWEAQHTQKKKDWLRHSFGDPAELRLHQKKRRQQLVKPIRCNEQYYKYSVDANPIGAGFMTAPEEDKK